MSDKEILEKAIQKAIDGGWNRFGLKHHIVDETATFVVFDNFLVDQEETWKETVSITQQTEAIIFNHDFAKALWGESLCTGATGWGCEQCRHQLDDDRPNWRCRIREMVISEDPIKYLGDNLPK